MSEIKIESIAKLELGPNDVLVVRLDAESVMRLPVEARAKYLKRTKDAVQAALDAAGLRNPSLFVTGENTHFSRLLGVNQPTT